MVVESGGTYYANVTLRNTGEIAWRKEGARVTARLSRFTPAARASDGRDSLEPVEIADATVELPADIPAGQEAILRIPITFGNSDGEPLPLPSPEHPASSLLSFEVALSEGGAVTSSQAVALVEKDLGAVFTTTLLPDHLPAGRSQPIRTSLRNDGPQAWLKESTVVGAHWYFLDGVEAQWEGQMTPIPRDLEPGGEITDLLAFVTPPPADGRYWLVLDVRIGDSWVSTLPGIRSNETRVHAVEVVGGSLAFADLSRSFNLDGISSDGDFADGNLDSGRSIPAEQIPPFATGDVAPSTLWLPNRGTGFASSRGIGFRWGPKEPKQKNMIQAAGQRIPLVKEGGAAEVYKVVHLLATSTKELPVTSFTLEFADGTQQLSSFPLSRWDAPPAHGEEVAFSVTRTHTPGGEEKKPVHFYRYPIRVGEAKKLLAIILPNVPEIKIAAITLEK
jgi:hypothetical protein